MILAASGGLGCLGSGQLGQWPQWSFKTRKQSRERRSAPRCEESGSVMVGPKLSSTHCLPPPCVTVHVAGWWPITPASRARTTAFYQLSSRSHRKHSRSCRKRQVIVYYPCKNFHKNPFSVFPAILLTNAQTNRRRQIHYLGLRA